MRWGKNAYSFWWSWNRTKPAGKWVPFYYCQVLNNLQSYQRQNNFPPKVFYWSRSTQLLLLVLNVVIQLYLEWSYALIYPLINSTSAWQFVVASAPWHRYMDHSFWEQFHKDCGLFYLFGFFFFFRFWVFSSPCGIKEKFCLHCPTGHYYYWFHFTMIPELMLSWYVVLTHAVSTTL